MTTHETLEHIAEQPRGTRFYCPAIATYNLTRAEAKWYAQRGFDVVAEDEITIFVADKETRQ